MRTNGDRLDWLGLDLWQFDDDGKVVRCDAYYKSEGWQATGRIDRVTIYPV